MAYASLITFLATGIMFSKNSNLEELNNLPPRQSWLTKTAHILKEIVETVVIAVLIAVVINMFVVRATRVYGQSMEPSLHTDQRLVVEKVSYNPYVRHYLNLDGPQQGDIVVLSLPSQDGELLIKRVIGLPGDLIEIHHGQVFINNQALDEPYLDGLTLGNYGPRIVPPLQVFVLGDNRNFSNDSRNFGTIPLKDVVGKAWFSYWPVSDIGFIE